MRLDASGRLLEINVPQTVSCTACDGPAERLSSSPQAKGIAYHNYRCRANSCPAGGTIVEHKSGGPRCVGPVFQAPRTYRPPRRSDHPASGALEDEHQPDDDQPAEKSSEAHA